MKTIKEIQAIIDRRKKLTYISVFAFIIFVLLLIWLRSQPDNPYSFLLLILVGFLIQMIFPFEPELSTYDRVRYSAYCLNISLNSRDTEKATSYLNDLAVNIEALIHKMENFPSQEIIIGTLEKLLRVLKYKIYPDLLKNENTDHCADIFENIQKAIEKGNINRLNNLIQDCSLEATEDIVLLPYEKPNFLNRICNGLLNIIVKPFYGNFIFRLMVLIIVLSTIGYLVSKAISSLKFDTTFFSAILVLAFGLTKEIRKK